MGEPKPPRAAGMPPFLGPFAKNANNPAVLGAFHANAHGIADIVTAATQPNMLAVAAPGIPRVANAAAPQEREPRMIELRPPSELASARATPATTFASGDFDGDGLPDLAYTLNSEGKNLIC